MVVVILVDCPLVLQRSLNTITGKEIFVCELQSAFICIPHFLQNTLPMVANFNHLVGVNISQPSSAYCFPFVFMRFGCLHPEVTFKYANLRPHLLRMTFSLLSVSGWKPPILDSDGKFLGASARAELRTSKWREAVCQGDAELSAWCCCQRLGWLRTRSCSSMDHSWATCEGEWDNGASRAEREMCFGKDGAWWHNK